MLVHKHSVRSRFYNLSVYIQYKEGLGSVSLAGLVFSWLVLPHGFKDVIWNFFHGGLTTQTEHAEENE